MEPYSYVGNNPIMFTDPTGMSKEGGEDHWEIRDGRAHLIDTEGDDIFVKNEGDKEFKKLSEVDFTKNQKAAKDIVSYYSSEYSLSSFNGGNFDLKPGYFSSNEAKVKAGYKRNSAMWIKSTFEPESLFSNQKLDIQGKFDLTGGKFNPLLNNKFNMRNAIGHEYKHFLDFLGIRSQLNLGVYYNSINKYSDAQMERRAIIYQMQLPSWCNTTEDFKNAMIDYFKKNSK